uniref:Uncharacterized protein n=1 Tax=Plectus sambesii TaxID=2011161 RepID=A0A914W470_9BILA
MHEYDDDDDDDRTAHADCRFGRALRRRLRVSHIWPTTSASAGLCRGDADYRRRTALSIFRPNTCTRRRTVDFDPIRRFAAHGPTTTAAACLPPSASHRCRRSDTCASKKPLDKRPLLVGRGPVLRLINHLGTAVSSAIRCEENGSARWSAPIGGWRGGRKRGGNAEALGVSSRSPQRGGARCGWRRQSKGD